MTALQRLRRDTSHVRVRNRDAIDGRPRGHLRQFALSRVTVRELAHRGELPGVSEASW
jgi:small subunit ribosomal protein S14